MQMKKFLLPTLLAGILSTQLVSAVPPTTNSTSPARTRTVPQMSATSKPTQRQPVKKFAAKPVQKPVQANVKNVIAVNEAEHSDKFTSSSCKHKKGPTGPTGPQGPTGPAGGGGGSGGSTGPTGPSGPSGPSGPTGPSGSTGPTGPQGVPGSASATGATGPSGPTGPTGPAGSASSTGATGPAGPTGPTGAAGTTGATGATGAAGAGESQSFHFAGNFFGGGTYLEDYINSNSTSSTISAIRGTNITTTRATGAVNVFTLTNGSIQINLYKFDTLTGYPGTNTLQVTLVPLIAAAGIYTFDVPFAITAGQSIALEVGNVAGPGTQTAAIYVDLALHN